MLQNPSKRKRARRHEHSNRLHQASGHRHLVVRVATESRGDLAPGHDHAQLAAAETPVSTSFDMLSVQPVTTSTQSTSEHRSTSRISSSNSTTRIMTTGNSPPPDTISSTLVESTSTFSTEALSTLENPQQLQAQPTSSVERTTLVVLATFPIPSATPGTPMTLLGITSAPRLLMTSSTTWARPVPSLSRRPSASASANPIVNPPVSHTHISPALIVFMVIGGFGALGLSLYVFRRVRYRAIHVSRSQFQISPPGPGGPTVGGSESNNSFVSGGLGRLDQRQKNDQMDPPGSETPLWGGREKFSPQPNLGTLYLPPVAHVNERIPVDRRRSWMDTFRHVAPGRLSRHGPGWNQVPDAPPVPTFRITDVDTNHHRGASGSSFSESPDPNLASIQVASVTRTLSATASYRGPPSSRLTMGLEDPRPAPMAPPKAAIKAPPKTQVYDRIPPVPRIPDVHSINTHLAGQKKHVDGNGRGKITVTDISKPLPVAVTKPEMHKDESNRATGETDPMAMYAKYSASLGVRNGSPEPIRRETSMAKKIAQIASSGTRPTIASASQTSFSNRDTRALAAAAGVTSPPLSGDRTPFRDNKKQYTASAHLPPVPVTPGWSEVGNMMLRPFDQSGSILPANLESPAIGPDGSSSHLSTNPGVEAGWRDRVGQGPGPLYAITAKPSENDISTLAASLRPSATGGPDRKTIMSAYSQDFMPLSQQAHMQQNPDYRSPTYSIYNYYGPDRISRVPGIIHGEQEIGGAL